MKKLFALTLTVLMFVTAMLPVSAANKIVGQALYTDIVAYIDGYPISSYNINSNTYIMVEDLANYGFSVTWDGAQGRLLVSTTRTAKPANYTTTYKAEKVDPALLSKKRADIYDTTITTWIGDKQVTGYNIGGQTLIWLDDLANCTGSGLEWVPAEKALKMTSAGVTPASNLPNSWKINYYVDKFDLPTSNWYIRNNGYLVGTFSNSATNNSKVNVDVVIDYEGDVTIFLYEYGSSMVKAYSTDYYDIYVRDASGKSHSFRGTMYENGNRIFVSNEKAFINLMLNNESLHVYIEEDAKYGYNSEYLFSMKRDNFAEVYHSMVP